MDKPLNTLWDSTFFAFFTDNFPICGLEPDNMYQIEFFFCKYSVHLQFCSIFIHKSIQPDQKDRTASPPLSPSIDIFIPLLDLIMKKYQIFLTQIQNILIGNGANTF